MSNIQSFPHVHWQLHIGPGQQMLDVAKTKINTSKGQTSMSFFDVTQLSIYTFLLLY